MGGLKTYKEHHAVSAGDQAVGDVSEGDARGADAMDEQHLFAVFRAELVDADRSVLR